MLNKKAGAIFIYNEAVDMRKSIDGLVGVVSSQLLSNPTDGSIYVFYNRGFDKVKLIYWSIGGFCLFYKRLEKNRFKFPNQSSNIYNLDHCQLHYLLDGLDLTKMPKEDYNKYDIYC